MTAKLLFGAILPVAIPALLVALLDRRGTHLTPTGNRWVADHLREYLRP